MSRAHVTLTSRPDRPKPISEAQRRCIATISPAAETNRTCESPTLARTVTVRPACLSRTGFDGDCCSWFPLVGGGRILVSERPAGGLVDQQLWRGLGPSPVCNHTSHRAFASSTEAAGAVLFVVQ